MDTERDGPASEPVDTELAGAADRLHLVPLNRLPVDAVTLPGDEELARVGRETSGIMWS
ncbi:hypothetical protein ABZT27_08455 [Streptomyces sp. NPDC005389]|uniref:hypothetical protein n=1 Tax=Streptomyces sp. NPDC005389 TaxID=3157040 RepID=UPI0033B55F62